EVRLVDGVIGNPPALSPRLQVLDHLLYGSNQQVRALKDLVRGQLRPTARQLLRRGMAILSHDHPLHQRIEFDAGVSFLASSLAHQPHPSVYSRRAPRRNIRRRSTAIAERNSRKTHDIGLTRGEGQQPWTIAADQDRRMGLLNR